MVMQDESPQAALPKALEAEATPQPAQDYEVHIKVSGEMLPLPKDGKSKTHHRYFLHDTMVMQRD